MSTISSWLLSIAGIIILSVLTEFILPDGQINKYVKVVFSFIILLVIIMPLPKLVNSNFSLSNYMQETDLQNEYLEQINLDKITTISNDLNEKISACGLENVSVSINANIFSEKLEIYGVSVDLRNIKYNESFENKTLDSAKEKIIKIIKSNSLLGDVEVKFYEQN